MIVHTDCLQNWDQRLRTRATVPFWDPSSLNYVHRAAHIGGTKTYALNVDTTDFNPDPLDGGMWLVTSNSNDRSITNFLTTSPKWPNGVPLVIKNVGTLDFHIDYGTTGGKVVFPIPGDHPVPPGATFVLVKRTDSVWDCVSGPAEYVYTDPSYYYESPPFEALANLNTTSGRIGHPGWLYDQSGCAGAVVSTQPGLAVYRYTLNASTDYFCIYSRGMAVREEMALYQVQAGLYLEAIPSGPGDELCIQIGYKDSTSSDSPTDGAVLEYRSTAGNDLQVHGWDTGGAGSTDNAGSVTMTASDYWEWRFDWLPGDAGTCEGFARQTSGAWSSVGTLDRAADDLPPNNDQGNIIVASGYQTAGTTSFGCRVDYATVRILFRKRRYDT